MLEVIKNNIPAYQLFLKLGFYEVGEMLVLRHPPFNQPPDTIVADAEGLDRSEALTWSGEIAARRHGQINQSRCSTRPILPGCV